MKVTLAEVFAQHWPSYFRAYCDQMPESHYKAAEAIMKCRTEEAGTVYYHCEDCGRVEARPVSCGHRACNACGHHKSMAWEAQQKARLLPVPYHMVTFTIPSEFRELFRSHQKLCYTLFFSESSGALGDLAADPQHLGGAIGMTGMLQTWTRDLRYHPHIHYLVPGGALTATGWVCPKYPDVLVPVRPLAVRMRNRFRMALKAADFKLYLTIPHKAWTKPWNVDARCVGSGEKAMEYVARYVQKTALDSARIIGLTADSVSFAWTDRKTGQSRVTRLSGHEFLRRFLQHMLPKGFVRVRHFGFLSAAAWERYERVRSLLKAGTASRERLQKPDICCGHCGCAMRFLYTLRGGSRAPPDE